LEIFETGPAEICADLLEIGIDKKKSNERPESTQSDFQKDTILGHVSY
jgi:hypothetical protein